MSDATSKSFMLLSGLATCIQNAFLPHNCQCSVGCLVIVKSLYDLVTPFLACHLELWNVFSFKIFVFLEYVHNRGHVVL